MPVAADGKVIVREKNIQSLIYAFLVDRRWWAVPLVLGLLAFAWSFSLSVESVRQQSLMVATESARNLFRMVKLTRLWNAEHGGVYMPVSDQLLPNPYLSVPHRDLQTTDGTELTLVNPAFMTRQLSELAMARPDYPVLFHITSLKPIRPQNIADDWESLALQRFETEAVDEIAQRVRFHGRDMFRFMGPLVTESACLQCHEEQGYKLGDIRGGISVTLDSEDYFSGDSHLITQSLIRHLMAYFLMAALMVVLLQKIRQQWLMLSDAEKIQRKMITERTLQLQSVNEKLLAENQQRKLAEQRYEAIYESVFDAVVSTDSAGFVVSWNAAAEKLFGYRADEMVGHNVTQIIPGRFHQQHKKGMSAVSMGSPLKVMRPMQVAALHKAGHEITVEMSLGHRKHQDHIVYSAVIRAVTDTANSR